MLDLGRVNAGGASFLIAVLGGELDPALISARGSLPSGSLPSLMGYPYLPQGSMVWNDGRKVPRVCVQVFV